MNERGWKKAVLACIPKDIHCESMTKQFSTGTPDYWLSCPGGKDLWIEFKFGAGRLTPAQARWLATRAEEGRNVAVCYGFEVQGRYRGWIDVYGREQLRGHFTANEVAEQITNFLRGLT